MNHTLSVGVTLSCLLAMFAGSCRAAEPAGGGNAPGKGIDVPKSFRVYVGGYTRTTGKGIYLYDFDATTGALKSVGLAAETANPSFVAMTPDYKYLYAVGEVAEFNGKKTGVVSAFAVDPGTGTLTLLNQQSTGGTGPCHVSLDSKGKVALVANYGSGTVASLPIGAGGKLAEAASVIQQEGQGPNEKRQEGPHAHGIWTSPPDDRFVLACDLGADKVFVYKLDTATGKLAPNDPPSGSVPAGGGARHLAFAPDHKFAYVINEMGNTMTAFAWDGKKGSLTEIQTLGTLPADFKGTSHTAEVVMHPSGKFLYGSNRGHDSLTTFAVDAKTGKLTYAANTPLGAGNWPRNFNIDPTGQWLIAAGEKSNTLTVFKIDANTGGLTQVGEPVETPSPACVIFTPAAK